MFNPTSPVTGAPQTGLTNPTYTLSADIAPTLDGKQFAVTALGGTQTGVAVHSGPCPFTLTMVRPRVFKLLGQTNPVTGLVSSVPMNVYNHILRKGMLPLAGQPYKTALFRLSMEIPAGAEVADAISIRAAMSCLFGAAWANSSAYGDTVVQNLL